jgi:hypothetical protein
MKTLVAVALSFCLVSASFARDSFRDDPDQLIRIVGNRRRRRFGN